MNVLQKLSNFEINFHRSGMKTYNFKMTIICSIILFITRSFSCLNAIRISKVPGHYRNRKIQYSTARIAVNFKKRPVQKKHLALKSLTLYILFF